MSILNETKISACPITIRSIDATNKVCSSYYDHGRAALTEAILSGVEFCFNPYATNLRPMIAFYLSHRFSLGERNLPTMEDMLFIIGSTISIEEENTK